MAEKFCANCGQALTALALSCSQCHQLTHAAQLEELTQLARGREAAGDSGAALLLWREALALLPAESKQAEFVRNRVAELGADVRLNGPALKPGQKKEQPAWIKGLGPFAAVGVALWKFKTVILLALGKGKFLLLGLSKMSTLFSMLASIGLYWSWFGWQFAVGFICGIYIHEMGHVWSLRHFGIRASAPMFIPGFGAFVSLYDSPADVHQDARIGLAGPLWGAAAGVAFWAVGMATGSGLWMAVARTTALINMFNLTPVWQLDGGRAFRALDYKQRLSIGVLLIMLWWTTGEGIYFLLLMGAAYRIFWQKDHTPPGDQTILWQYAGLAALFGVMMAAIPVRQ
ncbi:MAG: site-2 protease family protein [Acidobacteriota bacterium]